MGFRICTRHDHISYINFQSLHETLYKYNFLKFTNGKCLGVDFFFLGHDM